MNKKSLRILVIEDHSFQRRAMVYMLHALSIEDVWQANNGKHALEVMQADPDKKLDLVLCDLDMPEMDGMEFFRHLAKLQPGVSTLIISGMDTALISSVEKMASSYGLKILGAVEKPLSLDQLDGYLMQHLALKNASAAAAVAPRPTKVKHVYSLEEVMAGVAAKQIEPFLQPKVKMKSGRIVGAEALARWNHPEFGLVFPDDFIPQLERSGNMEALTFLMLEKTAHMCRLMQDKGFVLDMSVNLSVSSLNDTSLAERITEVVWRAGIEPQRIILEVTESAAMTNVPETLENLARLRMRGFGLSIDDYGTGFSSMQQLTRVPFTELKIDKSFVTDSQLNPASRVVVESSIDMARKLHVKSVAEGVETEQEWNMLRDMNCDVVQGYLIAKPMDSFAFVDFCERYKPQFVSASN
ncbi:MAG: hypothetical protein RL358_59 [Pseudomonadota bacterium]|jgi:EAL domain-containing protein (putative c-di-GMP-specific phosphodiesterase class I)/AmiR/NasT family two-component response regulator